MVAIFYRTVSEGQEEVGRLSPGKAEGMGKMFAEGYPYAGKIITPDNPKFYELLPAAFDGRYLRVLVKGR